MIEIFVYNFCKFMPLCNRWEARTKAEAKLTRVSSLLKESKSEVLMLEDKLQDMAWRLSRVEVTSSKSECAHKSAQNDIAYRNLELKLEKARILQRVRMRRRRKKRKTEKRTRSWRTLMLCRRLSVEEVLIVKGGQGEHLDVVHGCFNKLFVSERDLRV